MVVPPSAAPDLSNIGSTSSCVFRTRMEGAVCARDLDAVPSCAAWIGCTVPRACSRRRWCPSLPPKRRASGRQVAPAAPSTTPAWHKRKRYVLRLIGV